MKGFRKNTVIIPAVLILLVLAISVSRPVHADDFSYDAFLTQVLVPTYGFSPVGTTSRASVDWETTNWDSRLGIITISQQDFNADGVNDCLVYRIAKGEYTGYNGSESFWLDLYSHDTSGTINLINSVEISVDEDVNFHRIRVGLMSKQGQIFVYVEDVKNAYIADGFDYSIAWYGYDNTSFRPYYWVGKSRGGSDMITYSYYEYTDAQNYNETILKGDSYAIPAGATVLLNDGTVMDAILGGLKLIGLPDPSMEVYENSKMSLDPNSPDTFPSYYNSQIVKKVFEYNANGTLAQMGKVDLTITLSDYTGINTNQVVQNAAGGGAQAAAAGGGTGVAVNPNAGGAAPGGAAQAAATGGETGVALDPNAGGATPGGAAAEGPEPDPASVGQANASGQAATSGQAVQQDYLIPDSNSRYLSATDIANMTPQQLNYARNEIYARHGRMFNSIELQQYFASRSWYNPTISAAAFNDSVFNDFERQNVQTLLARERTLTGLQGGFPLDQPGYDINAVWR